MATIYTNSDDGWIYYKSTVDWTTARHAATGVSADDNDTYSAFPVAAYCTSGRGATTYYVYRAFLAFDTSGIGAAPSAATLKLRGYSQSSGDIIAIEGTWDGNSLATSNFNDFTGNTLNWNSSNVTEYSSEISSWSTSGYNDISLNSDALTAMADNDVLSIVIMNHTYDYSNVDPDLGGRSGCQTEKTGFYFTDYTGTDRDPYIDYTPGGYGHSVIGVDSGDIDTVIGVATADIDKVIGVD